VPPSSIMEDGHAYEVASPDSAPSSAKQRLILRPPSPEEAERNQHLWLDSDCNLWVMRQTADVPINEWDLHTNLGRIRRIEIPQSAREQALSERPELVMDSQVYRFLRDVWSNHKKYPSLISGCPSLRDWIQRIWAPLPQGSEELERKQLKKFFGAMHSRAPDPRWWPGFTYDEVSCWRIFVQIFPDAISLLEEVGLNTKMPYTKRMAISLLCSTLAMTDDSRLSSRATMIAARLGQEVAGYTVHSYRQYQEVRQFLFAAVAAGELSVERMVDFLHHHAQTKWEFRLNREYYRDPTDASFIRSIVQKCDRPLPREESIKAISEYLRDELLPRTLLEQTYTGYRKRAHKHETVSPASVNLLSGK